MEIAVRRVYDWASSLPPRVVFAARLAFGLLAIAVVGTTVDWQTVTDKLDGLLLPILAGIAFMLPALMIMALRWKLLIGNETPRRFSFSSAVRGSFRGPFFNLVMPGLVAGDVARSYYASVRAQITYSRSFLIVITERLFGLLSLCLLAGIGLALNDHLERFTRVQGVHFALGLTLVAAVVLLGVGLTQRYSRVPLLLFPWLLILSIIGQSADLVLVHFYGRVLSVNIPLEVLLLVLPLVFLASVIPLTPGGLGVREFTLTALLSLAGIPVNEAALVALMMFATKTGFGLLCGIALLEGDERGWLPVRDRRAP
jgi:glycosyltransferase 2 family protein